MDKVTEIEQIELHNKCRSCLRPFDDMYNLFEKFDQDLSLSYIFKMTMNFEVEDDGLPSCFCRRCTNVMVEFYNFKNLYQQNNQYLKSVLASSNKIMKGTREQTKEKVEQPSNQVGTWTSEYDENINKCGNDYIFLPESECILVVDEKHEFPDSENLLSEEEIEVMKSTVKKLYQGEHDSAATEIKMIISEESVQSKEPTIIVDDAKNSKSVKNHVYRNENECVLLTDNYKLVDPYLKNEQFQYAKYTCTSCNDYFLDKISFIKHMKVKHQVIPEYEQKVWKNLRLTPSMTVPLLNVQDGSVYLFCKECQTEFGDLLQLQKHLQTHILFLCHICGMGFKRKSSFKDHLVIHSSTRPYPCPVCDKRFSRKSVLFNHKKIHITPRQFVCEHCGKRFNEKGTLNLHRKCVHLRHKNFHCHICKLSFSLKSTLQKHTRRRHTIRQKTFDCSVCNSSFAEKAGWLRHYSKHFDSDKYICSVCQKEYTSKYTLMKHVRKCHSPTADFSRLSVYCEKITNEDCVNFKETTKTRLQTKEDCSEQDLK